MKPLIEQHRGGDVLAAHDMLKPRGPALSVPSSVATTSTTGVGQRNCVDELASGADEPASCDEEPFSRSSSAVCAATVSRKLAISARSACSEFCVERRSAHPLTSASGSGMIATAAAEEDATAARPGVKFEP